MSVISGFSPERDADLTAATNGAFVHTGAFDDEYGEGVT
jgi:hypothetical protein